MNKLYFNKQILVIPIQIKSFLWKFVRTDASLEDFEQWLYSQKEIENLLTEDSYVELLSLDFKKLNPFEIEDLRLSIYELLIQYKDYCACLALPNYTEITNYDRLKGHEFFYNQIENFKRIHSFHDFSGYQDRYGSYFHSAELCYCIKCDEHWLKIQNDDNDTFVARIPKTICNFMIGNDSWPNEKWPENLRNWQEFFDAPFKYVSEVYPADDFQAI